MRNPEMPIMMSREAVKEVATALWRSDHPDFKGEEWEIPHAEIINTIFDRVYEFDQALQACRLVVVKLA